MLNLSPVGCVLLVMNLLKHGRSEADLVVKYHRSNFFQRVMAVGGAVAQSSSYEEAAETIKARGWFSEIEDLPSLLETECDALGDTAMALNIPMAGLMEAKTETGQNPVQTQGETESESDGGDIPI